MWQRGLLLFLALCGVTVLSAQTMEERITFSLDRWDGCYEVGETVAVHVDVPEAFDAVQELWVNGNCVSSESVTVKSGKYDLLTRCDQEPTSVMLRLKHVDPKKKRDFTDVGYVVGREQFRPGFKKPADFYPWWMEQVEQLRKLPIEAKLTEVMVPARWAERYVCYDLEVNCGEGGVPVRGYLAMPRNADVKSLPICIFAHGAGVNGPSNRSKIEVALRYARQGGGSIALDINAHGMLNGQPQTYYDELAHTSLKGYKDWPIEDRESYYFRGMYLRMQRALDYLCSRDEWDGKRVLLIGGSQGGAQVAALSGLDKRVTHAVLRVPGMMDMGGMLLGRRSGPPLYTEGYTEEQMEAYLKWAPYFDMAFMLEHSRAKMLFDVGLVDMSVPTASAMVGYNLAAGEKALYTYPFRSHGIPKGKYRSEWDERVFAAIREFILDALK